MPVVFGMIAAASGLAMVIWNVAILALTNDDSNSIHLEHEKDLLRADGHFIARTDSEEDFERYDDDAVSIRSGDSLHLKQEEFPEGHLCRHTRWQTDSCHQPVNVALSATYPSQYDLKKSSTAAEIALAQILPSLTVDAVAEGSNEGPALCRERELAGLLARGDSAILRRRRRRSDETQGMIFTPEPGSRGAFGVSSAPVYGAAA